MLIARLACRADSNDIFSWRNDLTTRRSFFSSSEVSWKEHCDWFEKKLSSSSKIIILHKDNTKVGVVRYDKKDSSFYVSINTNPSQRGKGLSSDMLIVSEELLPKESLPLVLKAEILKSNKYSKQSFTKAGYDLLNEEQNFFIYKKLIIK